MTFVDKILLLFPYVQELRSTVLRKDEALSHFQTKAARLEQSLRVEQEKSARINALYQDQAARVSEARNNLRWVPTDNSLHDMIEEVRGILTRKPKTNFGQQGQCTPPKNLNNGDLFESGKYNLKPRYEGQTASATWPQTEL